MSQKIAIIDCGTNTFHLLIVQGNNILVREKAYVRIGKGGINSKIITEAAAQRALKALSTFSNRINQEQVQKTFAFATSAFRNATNGPELAEQVQKITGIALNIISGEREAELIYHGVNTALHIGNKPTLIMDIGGGSVEFIIGTTEKILWRRSYEIGAQRLLDLFHKEDPIARTSIEALNVYLGHQLHDLLEAAQHHHIHTLIGSSGTFDTLSAMYCEAHQQDWNDKDSEVPLPLDFYLKIHDQLVSLDRDKRLAIPGMIEMRVDMIVVASCIIKFLVEKLSIQQLRVSTLALKEGVLSQVQKGNM